ncbi:MAG: ROK family protein [Heyndrickxia sp.]
MKVVGIDIGGTSIKGIITNEYGENLQTLKRATEAALGRDHIIENLKRIIEELFRLHPDIGGIGIGTAGRVNVDTGEVVYATDNLKNWQGTNLIEVIQEEINIPVMVDNDANVALIGEHWLGAGKGLKNITMITLGTGVGGANMVNGEIIRGANWSGGEWGHVIFVPNGLPCNCGQNGCIEQYLSGNALIHFAEKATNQTYSSGMKVMQDYQNHKEEIVKVVEEYINHLAIILSNIHNGLNPEGIVIGGGVIESKDIWWNLLANTLNRNGQKVDVRHAILGNQAGSVGAAKMILDRLINLKVIR